MTRLVIATGHALTLALELELELELGLTLGVEVGIFGINENCMIRKVKTDDDDDDNIHKRS